MDSSFKCFYNLVDFPELPEKYIEEAKNSKYQLRNTPTLYWADSTFYETSFFKILEKEFKECDVTYSMNPPNSSYEWHIDMERNVTINWVIKTNPEARTFFKEPITDDDWYGFTDNGVPEKKPVICKLTELKYNSNKPTILDVTKQHCIYNNWSEERIILSLSVMGNTSYKEVVEFLQDIKIESY